MGAENRDLNNIANWPSVEEIEDKIAEEGVEYTASVWQILQCKKKLMLTPEMVERYYIIQKAHYDLVGVYLPDTIKGAKRTRTQVNNDLGPKVKDEVLDKAIQGGLAARLAKMREGK